MTSSFHLKKSFCINGIQSKFKIELMISTFKLSKTDQKYFSLPSFSFPSLLHINVTFSCLTLWTYVLKPIDFFFEFPVFSPTIHISMSSSACSVSHCLWVPSISPPNSSSVDFLSPVLCRRATRQPFFTSLHS